MGLGDEIMALGRAEALFEKIGHPVSICNELGQAREHDAWRGNTAWSKTSHVKIYDGAGCRPYIRNWKHRQAVFNLDYKARAGKIWLTEEEKAFCKIEGDFMVIAPFVKKTASVNKEWPSKKYEQVIKNLPIQVYQLMESDTQQPLEGAIALYTPTFRHAAAVIAKAKLVLCNEGGTHHMAASMRTKAVVIFGAFTPPSVTGYDFHENIAVETPEGYCGKYDYCQHCFEAMRQITPELVRSKVEAALAK